MSAVLGVMMLLLQAPAAPDAAAVAGQVRMPNGTPAAAVRVAAIPAPLGNIRPSEGQNYYAVQTPVRVALTGPDGRYRLEKVPPGRYLIVAGLIGQATYFPSTADPDGATPVTVEAGAAPVAVDINLVTSPGARVSGRVQPAPPAGSTERVVLSGTRLGELLELPVRADGTFEFGRVPRGNYLLNVFPTPPGMPAAAFRVDDSDVTDLTLRRPPVQTVSGRIQAARGPLPYGLLAFLTPQSHVSGTVEADGRFTVQLHDAQHRVDVAGMPVGYELRSVRVGGRDVTRAGLQVTGRAISDVEITVAVPENLPSLRGRVIGAVPSGARVSLTGPIFGSVTAPVRADGAFEVAALPPGLYELRVPELPQLRPMEVVVTIGTNQVEVNAR